MTSSTGGGALGFLSSGVTPGTSQEESESSTSLPSWYTDYTSQILNKVGQYAAEPYQAYKGPTVAGQDALTTQAGGQAGALSGQVGSGTQTATNLVNQGVGQVQGSVAPGKGGLSAANPYMAEANNSTADVSAYMNPYNQNVTDAIASSANRDFNNNTLPQMRSSIIGAGNITGFSTEGANLLQNAEDQKNQNITNAQAGALQSGYQGSQQAAQADAARRAQLASTAGTLGTQQQTAEQNAGTDVINAGGALSGITNAGAATQIGAEQNANAFGEQNQAQVQKNYDQAKSDFTAQKNDPLNKAAAMQGALSGITVPTTTTNYGASTGTPSTIGNSPLVTAGNAIQSIGNAVNG